MICDTHPVIINHIWFNCSVFFLEKTKNNNNTWIATKDPGVLTVGACTHVHCSKGNEVWRGFRDNTRNSLWYYTKIGKTNSRCIMNYFFSYLWIPASLHILFTSVQCTLFMVFTLNHVKETIVIMNIPSAMNRLSSENNNTNYWKPKSLYFLSMYS